MAGEASVRMTPTDPPLQPGDEIFVRAVARCDEDGVTLVLSPLEGGMTRASTRHDLEPSDVDWRRAETLDEADALARRCEELTAELLETRAMLTDVQNNRLRNLGTIGEALRCGRGADVPAIASAAAAAMAERDAMRPVVEAAEAWLAGCERVGGIGGAPQANHALFAAADTYRATQKDPQDAPSAPRTDERAEDGSTAPRGTEGSTAGHTASEPTVETQPAWFDETGRATCAVGEPTHTQTVTRWLDGRVEYGEPVPVQPSPTTVTLDNSAGRRDWTKEITQAIREFWLSRGNSAAPWDKLAAHVAEALRLHELEEALERMDRDALSAIKAEAAAVRELAAELTALRDLRHTLITALGGQERGDEDIAVAVRSLVENEATLRRKLRKARKRIGEWRETCGILANNGARLQRDLFDAQGRGTGRSKIVRDGLDGLWKAKEITAWAHTKLVDLLLLDDAAPPQHPDGTQTAAEGTSR